MNALLPRKAPLFRNLDLARVNDAGDGAQIGQYPTPVWVAEALVERYFGNLTSSECVLEPSCGPGSFLQAVPAHVPAIGVEIDPGLATLARINTGRHVITGDFLTVDLPVLPTTIIGNPPFNLKTIDGFLDRSHQLLPDEGCVGMILPAYAFQTAGRVARYAEKWSITQEMIPRNIYQGLSLPLVFTRFIKNQRRALVGFALYFELSSLQQIAKPYRDAICGVGAAIWKDVVIQALKQLGGSAALKSIYAEIEGAKPTTSKWWREKVRQTLRRYGTVFRSEKKGFYALAC
jgi:site-specific DNA-methyltransferase (adenine-specific)